VETVYSQAKSPDINRDILHIPQRLGRKFHLSVWRKSYDRPGVVPDSHFSAGIDYYCCL
jgi:hypothetical protein